MKYIPRLCLALAAVFLMQAFWIDIKAVVAQQLIAHAWQKSQAEQTNHKPWPWADTWPVAKISLKNQSFYVLSGASGHALAFGPAHLTQSALPGLGHTIIAAHKDTHFSALKEIQSGDVIELEDRQQRHFSFQVKLLEVVDSRQQQLELTQAQQLTLVTCYPFNNISFNGPLRLLVHAQLITPQNKALVAATKFNQAQAVQNQLWL